MKKALTTFFLILIAVSAIFSQNIPWKGAKMFGSSAVMRQDKYGNFYIFGKVSVGCDDYFEVGQYYYDTLKVEQLGILRDYNYHVLLKMDKNFNLIWKKRITGAGALQKFAISDYGDVAICFIGADSTIQVDNEKVIEKSPEKRTLIRFDPDGNVVWTGMIRGKDFVSFSVSDIKFDRHRNMYLVGNAGGDFIYIYNGKGEMIMRQKTDHYLIVYDANSYVIKQNTNYQFDYIKFITATDDVFYIGSITTDLNDNIYLVGMWAGAKNSIENIEKKPNRKTDGFIMKYTKDFKLLWFKQIGSKHNDRTEGFSYAKFDTISNSLYVTGSLVGHIEIDNQYKNVNDKNICLLKYCPDGILDWIIFEGYPSGLSSFVESGRYINIDKKGYSYVVGTGGIMIKYNPVNATSCWYYKPNIGVNSICPVDNNLIYVSGTGGGRTRVGKYWLKTDLTYQASILGCIAEFADSSEMIDEKELTKPCGTVSSVFHNNPTEKPFVIFNNYNSLLIKNTGENTTTGFDIKIFNIEGKRIYSDTFNKEIKIKHVKIGSPGIYIIRLVNKSTNKIFTSKISIL